MIQILESLAKEVVAARSEHASKFQLSVKLWCTRWRRLSGLQASSNTTDCCFHWRQRSIKAYWCSTRDWERKKVYSNRSPFSIPLFFATYLVVTAPYGAHTDKKPSYIQIASSLPSLPESRTKLSLSLSLMYLLHVGSNFFPLLHKLARLLSWFEPFSASLLAFCAIASSGANVSSRGAETKAEDFCLLSPGISAAVAALNEDRRLNIPSKHRGGSEWANGRGSSKFRTWELENLEAGAQLVTPQRAPSKFGADLMIESDKRLHLACFGSASPTTFTFSRFQLVFWLTTLSTRE